MVTTLFSWTLCITLLVLCISIGFNIPKQHVSHGAYIVELLYMLVQLNKNTTMALKIHINTHLMFLIMGVLARNTLRNISMAVKIDNYSIYQC